jgi:hypothetical protein
MMAGSVTLASWSGRPGDAAVPDDKNLRMSGVGCIHRISLGFSVISQENARRFEVSGQNSWTLLG